MDNRALRAETWSSERRDYFIGRSNSIDFVFAKKPRSI
jgi:hypothetical protein